MSIATTTLILLLSSISHVTQAKEVGVTAIKRQDDEKLCASGSNDVLKDKVCSFVKKSEQDMLRVVSDFVDRHDEAELKEKLCAVSSQRMAVQKFLLDSDVVSCFTEEMSVEVATIAKEAMSTEIRCNEEIDEEVGLILRGSRALRGVLDRELWIWIVVRIIIIIILLLIPSC